MNFFYFSSNNSPFLGPLIRVLQKHKGVLHKHKGQNKNKNVQAPFGLVYLGIYFFRKWNFKTAWSHDFKQHLLSIFGGKYLLNVLLLIVMFDNSDYLCIKRRKRKNGAVLGVVNCAEYYNIPRLGVSSHHQAATRSVNAISSNITKISPPEELNFLPPASPPSKFGRVNRVVVRGVYEHSIVRRDAPQLTCRQTRFPRIFSRIVWLIWALRTM